MELATLVEGIIALPLRLGVKGRQSGFKDGGVLKSQTNPGERGWLSVWFAFGALILRRLAYGTERVLRRRETKKTDLGTHWGGLNEGGGETSVKSKPSCSEGNLSTFLAVSLLASDCGNSRASPATAGLYLRNALSGLRALLISGGLDWLLSAELLSGERERERDGWRA